MQTVTLDEKSGTLRISHLPLREPAKFFAAPDSVEPARDKLAAVSETDVIRFKPQCDVILRLDGTAFSGEMAPRACNRGPEMYFDHAMTLAADRHAFREQARRWSDGGVGWEQAPGSNYREFELVKARPVSWEVSLMPGRIGTASGPQTPSLTTHSEGGMATMTFPGAPPIGLMAHTRAEDYIVSLVDQSSRLPTASATGRGGDAPIRIDVEPFIGVACRIQ